MPAFTQWECWRPSKARGRLIGGYFGAISLLYRTSYWPPAEDNILFWEAFQTQPHDIERQFAVVETEGMFEKVTGMVAGKLVGCEEKDYEGILPDIKEILLEISKEYGFPIID